MGKRPSKEQIVGGELRSPTPYPKSAPWTASIGALFLASSACSHLAVSGDRIMTQITGGAGGSITLSPPVKLGLLTLAVASVVFAIGLRRVEWGPFPFLLTSLGALLSMGYFLRVAGFTHGTTAPQYQRILHLSGVAVILFGTAIVVTLRQIDQNSHMRRMRARSEQTRTVTDLNDILIYRNHVPPADTNQNDTPIDILRQQLSGIDR